MFTPSSSLLIQENKPSFFLSRVIIFFLIWFLWLLSISVCWRAQRPNPCVVLGWDHISFKGSWVITPVSCLWCCCYWASELDGSLLALCCWLIGVRVCPKPSSVLTTPPLTQGLLTLETTLWFSPWSVELSTGFDWISHCGFWALSHCQGHLKSPPVPEVSTALLGWFLAPGFTLLLGLFRLSPGRL